jgi:hypothetical protein
MNGANGENVVNPWRNIITQDLLFHKKVSASEDFLIKLMSANLMEIHDAPVEIKKQFVVRALCLTMQFYLFLCRYKDNSGVYKFNYRNFNYLLDAFMLDFIFVAMEEVGLDIEDVELLNYFKHQVWICRGKLISNSDDTETIEYKENLYSDMRSEMSRQGLMRRVPGGGSRHRQRRMHRVKSRKSKLSTKKTRKTRRS